MAISISKKILFPAITALIVSLTSVVFNKTQPFYMLFAQGQVLIRSKDYSQAQDIFLKALILAPKDIRTMQYILFTDEKLNISQGAQKAYTIVENAGTSHAPFALYVADHFYSEAYYEKAERIYRKLITEDRRWDIKKKLAEVLLWQKKHAEAIVLLEDLVQKVPTNKNAQLLLANAHFWNQQYASAIELYEVLIGTGVQTDEMILNLAQALRLSGRDEEAIKIYDTFLQHE